MNRHLPALLLLVVGCSSPPSSAPAPPATAARPQPLRADGIDNLFRVSDRVYSGDSPDGDAGFASLEKLGVKTVISVDGAAPDVATAERHGLRYVHLPVGYDGIPRERALELAKAVRDLPGPVYVHCHHGQHRGPAAVAAVQLCLDPTWTPDTADEWLKAAGTDPKYTGLLGLPRSLVKPTTEEIDEASSAFPATTPPTDLRKLMVSVDARWDALKLVKDANWAKPKDHPDTDPPHEAVQLAELYREAARLDRVTKDAKLKELFTDAEKAAGELKRALKANDAAAAAKAFAASQQQCGNCHASHRDAAGR